MKESIEELKAKLVDSESGFFEWSSREDRLDIYQSGIGWPLVTTAIDGRGVAATWQSKQGKRKSETLFMALKKISNSWSAVYIQHHDEAVCEIAWVEAGLGQERLDPRILEEFTDNPADQGGTSFLGLFAEVIDDMVLFTYDTDEFRISVFGRMKVAVPEALDLAPSL